MFHSILDVFSTKNGYSKNTKKLGIPDPPPYLGNKKIPIFWRLPLRIVISNIYIYRYTVFRFVKLIEWETGHWAAIFIFHCNAKYKRRILIFVKILWYFMIFGWYAQGIKALAHLSRVIILHQNATTGKAATFATIAKFVQHFKRKKTVVAC